MNHSTETYDYVIVGSGAAGSILANRLSAHGHSVCLLEAGPADRHPFLHIPAGFIKVIFDERYAWQFHTMPNTLTNSRSIPIPQGRTLGGSTAINGLVYNRGLSSDYDHWESLGNEGWGYEQVLPYFKSMERRVGGDDRYRGRSGELPVSDIDWKHPLCDAFIEAAQEYGMVKNPDYNGDSQEGVGFFQRTIHKGRRMSTAKVFLQPSKGDKNLTIKTNAQASQVIFKGKNAIGVRYFSPASPNSIKTVHANKEVIISAGAINTPKLLQLSGVGDAAHLRKMGIEVVKDLPGVGSNLSDHYSVRMAVKVRNTDTMNELVKGVKLAGEVIKWVLRKPSILGLSPSLVHFFAKSDPSLTSPDLQGVFTPASYRDGYVGQLDEYPGMTAGVWQHRPKSRGYVQIQSTDPLASPIVQPNYLSEEQDQKVLIRGVKLTRSILQQTALAHYYQSEILPGASCQSDDEILDFAKSYGVSSYHVNGTARMGPATDKNAVVDSALRVHGLTGLRIVDSSVMPSIPSANICAATMMIANKAADLIGSERLATNKK
ncbi:MAG: GMC family oxidoreductase N-terminal domain-containing protein [Burkholderiaceae bacterium]|nr:GMC family oxidoreductase N-terminal domain-containing protein [Burkholderiaceae bacterium]